MQLYLRDDEFEIEQSTEENIGSSCIWAIEQHDDGELEVILTLRGLSPHRHDPIEPSPSQRANPSQRLQSTINCNELAVAMATFKILSRMNAGKAWTAFLWEKLVQSSTPMQRSSL